MQTHFPCESESALIDVLAFSCIHVSSPRANARNLNDCIPMHTCVLVLANARNIKQLLSCTFTRMHSNDCFGFSCIHGSSSRANTRYPTCWLSRAYTFLCLVGIRSCRRVDSRLWRMRLNKRVGFLRTCFLASSECALTDVLAFSSRIPFPRLTRMSLT